MSDKKDTKGSEEQLFRILPHPDKSSEPTKEGEGVGPKPALQAFNTPGPVIPNREDLANAGPPATSEELAARTAELNQ